MTPPPRPLPHSLRDALIAVFVRDLPGSAGEAQSEHLAKGIEQVAKTPAGKPLRALARKGAGGAPLVDVVRACMAGLPATRRAEALVDALSARAGLVWQAKAAEPVGPIALSAKERERIEKRLDRLWEQLLTRHDDEPEAEEWADALMEEVGRIGAKVEALAVRAASRRFAEALWQRKLRDRKQLLRFFEEQLEITWQEAASSPEGPAAAPAPPKAYAPGARFAVGDLVEHPKLGAGTVVAVEATKVRIRFADAERVLVCAGPAPAT